MMIDVKVRWNIVAFGFGFGKGSRKGFYVYAYPFFLKFYK